MVEHKTLEKNKQYEQDFQNKKYRKSNTSFTSRLILKFNWSLYRATGRCSIFFKSYLASHCKGKSVLEYGCGINVYSLMMAENGASVTGIDISDFAINSMNRMARGKKLDANFICMDAEAMTFDDDRFDMICGAAILHHLDLERSLKEVSRTLKADGNAIFIEPLGYNPIINLYRKLTPQIHTTNEHPFVLRDFKLVDKYFGKREIRYFHLSSFLAVPFYGLPGFRTLLKALDAFDDALFRRIPASRRYASMFVMVLSEPLKQL